MPRIFQPFPDPTSFVGRAQELHALHEHFAGSSRQPLWITGDRRTGKTTLLLAFAHDAAGGDGTFLRVNAHRTYDIDAIPMLIADRYGGAVGRQLLQGRLADERGRELSVAAALSRVALPRILLGVDDVHDFAENQISRLLTYVKQWSPKVRTVLLGDFIRLSRHITISRGRVIDLNTMASSDLLDALRVRLVRAGFDERLAERVMEELHRIGFTPRTLTFEIIFRIADAFAECGDLPSAIASAFAELIQGVPTLVLTSEGDRIRAIAISAAESTCIAMPSSRMLTATPLIVVPGLARVWRSKLDFFEELINSPNVRESEIQRFFETNDELLCGIEYERAVAHPVLQRDSDESLIPDFFLKPANRDLIDVLDLKLPTAKVVVGSVNRRRLSASVVEAIAQLREYRNYFESPRYRERVLERYGVHGYRPKTIVVIGRTPDHDTEEKRQEILDDLPHHVEIVTYDDLLNRMRRNVWARLS